MRKGFCITSEDTGDNFVGVRFSDGKPEVVFPRGYNIPDDEKERRRDVFRLLAVLQRFSDIREGGRFAGTADLISVLPIVSYQYIMQDFLVHGYYVEREVEYISANRGKVNWKKTVQKEDTYLSDNGPVFLKFQVKHSRINENTLITRIHRYCVYESFRMFGWLYFADDYLPPEPDIKLDQKLFTTVLNDHLRHTNNDSKKRLFSSMLNIINMKHEDINFHNNSIGVNHFAGVWERLIDHVFGEPNIEEYFPRATWHILQGNTFKTSSALEPDTIMKYDGKIYILDAKYYQYGVTWAEGDLPNTSSIQKQITYGRHVKNKGEVPADKIYNAFIMPYNCDDKDSYILKFVAVGSGGWEDHGEDQDYNYKYILGILLDTRHLITTFSRHNISEIENLAGIIEESIEKYRAVASSQIS